MWREVRPRNGVAIAVKLGIEARRGSWRQVCGYPTRRSEAAYGFSLGRAGCYRLPVSGTTIYYCLPKAYFYDMKERRLLRRLLDVLLGKKPPGEAGLGALASLPDEQAKATDRLRLKHPPGTRRPPSGCARARAPSPTASRR